jgi:hypothetical protein
MKLKELKQIYESAGKREGWYFSKINYTREVIPWKYSDIVQNYLKPTSYVTDIGTRLKEIFTELIEPNIIHAKRLKVKNIQSF